MSNYRSWKSSPRQLGAALYRVAAIGLLVSLAACEAGKPTGYVSQVEMGDQWPLTVPEGVLECETFGPRKVVVFAVGADGRGQMYAVNGQAKSKGFPSIEPIWKTVDGVARINIGPLIERGLKLCK